MDPKDLEFEETLADSELLLKNTARSMDEDAEFTLESILAEYGSGTPAAPEPEEKASEPPAEEKQSAKVVPLPKKAEAAKKTVDETADETARIPVIPFPGAKKAEEPVEAEPEETPEEEPAQDDEPKSMSLQDILAQTVQEALSEREDTIIEEEPPRRGLFSRRKMRDTEQLYDDAEEEEDEEEEFEEPEPELPEPPLTETLSDYRAQLSGATKARRGAGIFDRLRHRLAHFCGRAALAQTGKSHVGLFDDASMPCHAARYGALRFSSRTRGAVAAAAGAGGDVGLLRAAGRKPASARHV